MAKQRVNPSKAVRDSLLDEFNHRCAVCGVDRPQVHHIDENPSNNDPLNLILRPQIGEGVLERFALPLA